MGCIGVGNKGIEILNKFMRHGDCQIVAVCDVNRGSYGYRDPDRTSVGSRPRRSSRRITAGRGRREITKAAPRTPISASSCAGRHRRRDRLHAGPLARDHDDRRGRGG